MRPLDNYKEARERYEFQMGPARGSLATALDVLTDALALVGQHGVYCRSTRQPQYPSMDVRIVLRSLGNGGMIEPGDIRNGGFGMLLAGDGWGEGSSREVAALALLYAGIGIVFAPSIAPIHRQNLINNGMFPVTDLALAKRLAAGERLQIDEIIANLDEINRKIVRYGGL